MDEKEFQHVIIDKVYEIEKEIDNLKQLILKLIEKKMDIIIINNNSDKGESKNEKRQND